MFVYAEVSMAETLTLRPTALYHFYVASLMATSGKVIKKPVVVDNR